MAQALEQSGTDPLGALKAWQRVLEVAPDDLETLKRLGAACASLERWDKVAQLYNFAIKKGWTTKNLALSLDPLRSTPTPSRPS